MNFIFNCTETGEIFETDDFALTENEGTATTPDGRMVLKAMVTLNTPCPICGQWHRYRAEDLACPFHSN